MKISYSKYALVTRGTRDLKTGALLRVRMGRDEYGYADCHPCVKHGDLPLEQQLALLAERKKTRLTELSLLYARYDALARKEQHYCFSHRVIPLSNSLVVNEHEDLIAASEHVSMMKIKVGAHWEPQIEKVRSYLKRAGEKACRLRLDFSESLTEQGYIDFIKKTHDLKPHLDYVEDPFPYDAEAWTRVRKATGVRVACDQQALQALPHARSCDVIVMKPATHLIDGWLMSRLHGRQLVITSYLDHPIGQLVAAYVAAGAKQLAPDLVGVCGLLTHSVFEETPFSRRLSVQNGSLIPPKKGLGWGFDDLLEALPWEPL